MFASATGTTFSLKIMINKQETKVLFAEVDRNFADILVSFLTLPLGTIVKLLKKYYGDEAPLIGSLNTPYKSVENLDTSHFWTEAGKLMLLNPRNSFESECSKLKLNIDDTEPAKYYLCEDECCYRCDYSTISMYYDTAVCGCGRKLNRVIDHEGEAERSKGADADSHGIFTMKTLSFLITDDLRMVPVATESIIQTLADLNVTDDADDAEQRVLTVGFNEIMDLLKGSLLSRDLVLQRKYSMSSLVKFELLVQPKIEEEKTLSSCNQKKTSLKVIVQKSSNRVVLAHAKDDFVDFIFSFRTIPLGGVEYLLGGNTSLTNIDNLYRSVANLDKYLKDHDKGNVLNPELPPMFLSGSQILPLIEQKTTTLYYYKSNLLEHVSPKKMFNKSRRVTCRDPKGRGSFVVGDRVYMVSDDLTVELLCMSSTLSVLKSLNIKLSDVREVDVEIGVKEGLSILKASLTKTSGVLITGLSHVLLKEPKKETLV